MSKCLSFLYCNGLQIFVFVILYGSMMACSRSYKISPEDFKGVELETPYPPTGYKAIIKASSTCPSLISIKVNDVPLNFRYSGEADTSFRIDYYDNAAFVEVEYDSCTIEAPRIYLIFY